MAPGDTVHVCKKCLSEIYENDETERTSLGDCFVCDTKTIGHMFNPLVLRKR